MTLEKLAKLEGTLKSAFAVINLFFFVHCLFFYSTSTTSYCIDPKGLKLLLQYRYIVRRREYGVYSLKLGP